jgi:hypothetical protein
MDGGVAELVEGDGLENVPTFAVLRAFFRLVLAIVGSKLECSGIFGSKYATECATRIELLRS